MNRGYSSTGTKFLVGLLAVAIAGALVVLVWLVTMLFEPRAPGVPSDSGLDVRRVCIEKHVYYTVDEGVKGVQGRSIALAPVLQDDGRPVPCEKQVKLEVQE